MSVVRIHGGEFVVEAEDLARAFGVTAGDVIRDLREGNLTSRCEKGIDEHEGRHRLIFSHKGRMLRLTVDREGRILSRMMVARPPAPE
jgi:hypothetical protein